MVAIRGQTVTMRRADNRFDAREILVASGVPDSEKARLAGLLGKEGVRFGDGPVWVSLRHAELLTNATKLKIEMAPLLAVAQGLNLPENGPINPDRDRPLPSVEGPPARAAPSITLGPPLEGIFQTILYRRNAIAYIPSQRFVNLRHLDIAYGLHHESALRWIKRHKVECQQITAVRTGFRGTYVHYAAAQAYCAALGVRNCEILDRLIAMAAASEREAYQPAVAQRDAAQREAAQREAARREADRREASQREAATPRTTHIAPSPYDRNDGNNSSKYTENNYSYGSYLAPSPSTGSRLAQQSVRAATPGANESNGSGGYYKFVDTDSDTKKGIFGFLS
ncbi:hypothetical protein B0J18DRAFT_209759 [Chaetomium sp. MPI-SDFR-AT-0129]|nr:hypothetical protein B0J18DRAFT_209759 [Chaetomium sp. MPI-SDFR-AT-0129]